MVTKPTKYGLKLMGNAEKRRYWKNRDKKMLPENECTKKQISQLRKK